MKEILALCVVLVAASALAADWKPAPNPLMTRWARDVSPANAHPEYPRPQMVRERWQNLNGLWDYAVVARDAAQPATWDGKILVPYPIESALSGVRKRVSKDQHLWYHRTFTVPAAWKGQRVLLHFGAVDWEAVALVNGKQVGSHKGGYGAFSFDITDALKPGDNALVLRVFDPTSDGAQARGKQVNKPGGIWYTPTTGIWQTVWLEPVSPAHIESFHLVPDIDAGTLTVSLNAQAQPGKTEIAVAVLDGGKPVTEGSITLDGATKPGLTAPRITIAVKNPKLWTPDSPFLYDLKLTLKSNGKVVDEITSYVGMRKTSIGKDENGVTRLLLNNKFVFQIGFLDQGFWPDGLYTAPTDEALRYDIEATKKLGMNLARKHVKIEPARWYYWADKLGLLVWQDMPSGNTTRDRKQFQSELAAMVTQFRNHPSIVVWVPFNEGWGQVKGKRRSPDEQKGKADTQLHVDLIHKLDPTRPVNSASGWVDYGVGEILDVHAYPGPNAPPVEEKRAIVLGEFGGLGLPLKGHLWQEDRNWGYRTMADRDDLTRRYVKLLQKTWQLVREKGLSAAVYTQTTDVEIEVNGLMTYDRAIIKPDAETVAKANRGDFPPPPKQVAVIPTSEQKPQIWRYTTEKPAAGWQKPGFDDSAWKKCPGGFGTKGTPGTVVRTEWKGKDIWIRRDFSLDTTDFADLHLRMHHDEDAEVHINGVLAARVRAFTTEYDLFSISAKAKAALEKGKNVLAIHCKQTMGGQYIDAGLVDLVPVKAK